MNNMCEIISLCECCNSLQLSIYNKEKVDCRVSGNTFILKKENKHLPSTELQTGRMSVHLKAVGHGWAAKTQLQEQEREREGQGLSRKAKQLIIGSYYWGIVSARTEVGFQTLLKTLMVQNRPHYRDIISIHTLTEPLGFLLGKIRFLHLRTSSLGAWLTEQCSQLRAHPHSSAQLNSAQFNSTQLNSGDIDPI